MCVCVHEYVCVCICIGLLGRAFASGQGDQCSVLGRIIPKTKKWYLMPHCLILSIIGYGSRGKVEQSRERSSPLPNTSV